MDVATTIRRMYISPNLFQLEGLPRFILPTDYWATWVILYGILGAVPAWLTWRLDSRWVAYAFFLWSLAPFVGLSNWSIGPFAIVLWVCVGLAFSPFVLGVEVPDRNSDRDDDDKSEN